jgi:outer membrane receptor protein involved in Fe transport
MVARSFVFAMALLLVYAVSGVAAGAAPATSATATSQSGSISGTVVEANGGLPVPSATVELERGRKTLARTTTQPDGSFRFADEPPAVYSILISRSGYQSTIINNVVVAPGRTVYANTAINRGAMRTIAVVSTSGRQSLQTSTTINQFISPTVIQNQDYVRASDALTGIAGVTPSTSSAVGDDEFISIRGYNASETATLLDGHRIGPLGSAVNAYTTFDSQISPFFGLNGIQVVYGSGAAGLFGVDAIGGSIDYQTISPTATPQFTAEQGWGNDGKLLTGLQATGTVGKFAYAVVHAVEGTYGSFAPQKVVETGLLGNDFTSSNYVLNTYTVTGNYDLRNDLLKLQYDFDPGTQLMFTGYSATIWEDKTGNGDEDFLTYPFQLFNAQQALAQNGNMTSITLPNGTTETCTGSIAVLVNPSPGYACVTPQQYARESSGPAGGGPGPFQGIRNQDYDLRFTKTLSSANDLTIDGYIDNYAFDFNRFTDSAFFRSYFYLTHGLLIADHITGGGGRNDLGFGFAVEHQNTRYDQFPDIYTIPGGSLNRIGWGPSYIIADTGWFANDQYFLSDRLSLFANLWYKSYNVTPIKTLDPRFSVVYRPTTSDVLRVTAGHSASVPQPGLVFSPTTINGNTGSFFPNCANNLQSTIGSSSNRNLQPEKATDEEFAYGHLFGPGDFLQVNLYDSYEQGAFFDGNLLLTATGVKVAPSIINAYLRKIASICPNIPNPTVANLNVDTTYNAASARYRGIEITGRVPVVRGLSADYMYDVQSAFYEGIPVPILQQNVTDINGAQVQGIPLHKASIGLEYQTTSGLDIRFDGYHIDANNPYDAPAYNYANASISNTWGHVTLTFGVNNVFNSIATQWGLIGLGQWVPENQYGTDTSSLSQGDELYGMPYRQFMLTARVTAP